jgi:hypothetical protein
MWHLGTKRMSSSPTRHVSVKQSFAHFSIISIPQLCMKSTDPTTCFLTPSQMACASNATVLNEHELDFSQWQPSPPFLPFRYATRLRVSRKAT